MNTLYHILIRRTAVVLALAMATLLGGCNTQPYVTPGRLDRGLVVVLTGIEGRSVFNESIADGLAVGGVDWAIEITDWTSEWGMLASLRDETRNRAVAKDIARRIMRYQIAYPGRPVMVLGQSGGGGMAVYTAEYLGETSIQGILLLNAAISRNYRLTRALRNSELGLVNYYSPLDMIVRWGTMVAGTMDSRHVESSGSVGFDVPTTLPAEYNRLYQVKWTREMIDSYHIGNHLSSSSTDYVAKYLAPLILAPQWDQKFIDYVKTGQGHAALKTIKPRSMLPAIPQTPLAPQRQPLPKPPPKRDGLFKPVAPWK